MIRSNKQDAFEQEMRERLGYRLRQGCGVCKHRPYNTNQCNIFPPSPFKVDTSSGDCDAFVQKEDTAEKTCPEMPTPSIADQLEDFGDPVRGRSTDHSTPNELHDL